MLGYSDCGGDSTDSYWRLRPVSTPLLLDLQRENSGSCAAVCHVCNHLLMKTISEIRSYFLFIAPLQFQIDAELVLFQASNCGKLSKFNML